MKNRFDGNIMRMVLRPKCVAAPLPFFARTMGHYKVDRTYIGGRKVKNFVQLYWCINGEGVFYLKGKEYPLKPGYVAYYLGGDFQHVKSNSACWEYRWLTFAGPLANEVMEAFQISRTPHFSGKCPEDLFIMLENEMREKNLYSQRMASSTVYKILAVAANYPHKYKTLKSRKQNFFDDALALMRNSFSDPETNVDSISRRLRVHRVSLSRVFRERIKTSPSRYLMTLRMEKAKALLNDMELSIKQISGLSGFSDANYFEKVFRKFNGKTPTEHRSG